MGKRIVISEQEKKDIKDMYNLNEDWIDDVVGFIKKAGKKIKSYFTSKDGKDLSDDDIKKKMSDIKMKESHLKKRKVQKAENGLLRDDIVIIYQMVTEVIRLTF
jgi:hypothetical protein